MDIWGKDKRSVVMAKIKSKNTKPEIDLRSALFSMGYRFRIHSKKLPGKPDIVLPKYKTVIFVHGCFWHLHKDCREGRIPSSNTDYWREKLHKNANRDAMNIEKLQKDNWKVLVVWECQIENNLEQVLQIIISNLKSEL